MQDKYAGDIGDFGKLGLLRHFGKGRKMGVVWYLYPDESNNDGRHIDYLESTQFKECDHELFNKLKSFVNNGSRSVADLERLMALPSGTSYFSDRLHYNGIQHRAFTAVGKQARLTLRESWVTRAIQAMQGCEIVFLDPDNGLEVPSIGKHTKKGPKFVFDDELRSFLNIQSVKTIVVYHHLNRHINYGDHSNQMRERQEDIRKVIDGDVYVSGVRFRPRSPRAFFLITRCKTESGYIQKALSAFMQTQWADHFDAH